MSAPLGCDWAPRAGLSPTQQSPRAHCRHDFFFFIFYLLIFFIFSFFLSLAAACPITHHRTGVSSWLLGRRDSIGNVMRGMCRPEHLRAVPKHVSTSIARAPSSTSNNIKLGKPSGGRPSFSAASGIASRCRTYVCFIYCIVQSTWELDPCPLWDLSPFPHTQPPSWLSHPDTALSESARNASQTSLNPIS